MKLAPATEEALDYEVAPNSEEVAVVSEEAPESELAPNSEEALDLEMAMDSVEVPLVVPDNVEMVADSVERDFVECLCPRCGTIHAGGVFSKLAAVLACVPVVAFSTKTMSSQQGFFTSWRSLIVSSTFRMWRNFK